MAQRVPKAKLCWFCIDTGNSSVAGAGLTMYGQMTAGTGLHRYSDPQGTYESPEAARKHFSGSLKGGAAITADWAAWVVRSLLRLP